MVQYGHLTSGPAFYINVFVIETYFLFFFSPKWHCFVTWIWSTFLHCTDVQKAFIERQQTKKITRMSTSTIWHMDKEQKKNRHSSSFIGDICSVALTLIKAAINSTHTHKGNRNSYSALTDPVLVYMITCTLKREK